MNKLNPIERRNAYRKAKKFTAALTSALCMAVMCSIGMTVFAAGGGVDTSGFLTQVETTLQAVVELIGAGLGVWGVVNLIEGYGNDNPGAKSQGMKQLMAGLALILLGIFLIPELIKMMSAATGATTKK